MAIEDLNTIFGTSAPGASAKLAQAALQVAHLVPVPGERPVLVLDEKWRRPAAPHLGTGRHAHAARTLAGRITQIELQRHGAASGFDRTPNFETRIDPKRGAWPTLPTCVATERAELRQRALGAGREAVAARRRRGGAPRGQAHARALASPSLRCAARSTPRSTRPRHIGRRRLRRRRRRERRGRRRWSFTSRVCSWSRRRTGCCRRRSWTPSPPSRPRARASGRPRRGRSTRRAPENG